MNEDTSLIEGFVEESKEHLETIEDDILTLEKQGNTPDLELVDQVFRAMHTIKGNAGFFEFFKIRDLAHALEDLLSCVRNQELYITKKNADTVLDGVDLLTQMIDNPLKESSFDIDVLVSNLRMIIAGGLGKETANDLEDVLIVKSEGNQNRLEISRMDYKKVQKSESIYILRVDLVAWEKREEKSPIYFIKRLLNFGLILTVDSDIQIPKFGSKEEVLGLHVNFAFSSPMSIEDLRYKLGIEDSEIEDADIVGKVDELLDLSSSLCFQNMVDLATNVSQKDLGSLVQIMDVLEEFQLDDDAPAAAKKVTHRLYALATNILMGETSFELGKQKLIVGLKKLAALESANQEKAQVKKDEETQKASAPDLIFEETSMDGSSDVVRDFIATTLGEIDAWSAIVLELEKGTPGALESIKGTLHTLKGELGFLGQNSFVDLIHEIESQLETENFSAENLLTFLDYFTQVLRDWQGGSFQNSKSFEELFGTNIQEVESTEESHKEQVGENESLAPSEPPEVFETLAPVHSISKDTNTKHAAKEAANQEASNTKAAQLTQNLKELNDEKVDGENSESSKPVKKTEVVVEAQSLRAEESLRVGVGRLDRLIDAIGEAVIAHGIATGDKVVANIKEEVSTADRAQLKQKLDRLDVIMRQIQEYSMSLRMVNLKTTFQKMARLVRDLSRQLNKPVEFQMEGEDTELDKSIVEHLADPLIHLIRNSMDHGLEDPADRLASGKSETGVVTIRSYHKSGNVVIEVEDDGHGIDPQKILAKAIEKGIVKEDQFLDESEILRLIFSPGFSTAASVTQISGRGVGMDVVKRNIEALRGAVDIQSELGKGTLFTIKLPLTLAIINGMVVACKHEKYIIPTLSVIETLRIKKSEVQSVTDKGHMIKLRDQIVKVYNLNEGLDVVKKDDWDEKIGLIVEDSMGRKCAFLVDSIIDQQQVVIKKLSDEMDSIQSLAGGAIMNDGSVSLILDVSGLLRMAFEA